MGGSAESCNIECHHDPIATCEDHDGCCQAEMCDYKNDTDCWPMDVTSGEKGVDVGDTLESLSFLYKIGELG
jgi:hypothetical protein